MLSVRLISQERELLSAQAGEVLLPTTLGQIAVLPQHQTMAALLKPGEVELKSGLNGKTLQSFAVSGGIAEVREGNTVTILVEEAEEAEGIVEERAREAKERAETMLREEGYKDDVKFADAAAALERALARLRVVRKRRSRGRSIES